MHHACLQNGRTIPMLGYGTWRMPTDLVQESVELAIDLGYRHFDCAYVFGNEIDIGRAIRMKICKNIVRREDLYITNKLWCTFHRPELVKSACCESLRNMGLRYFDLYVMQWPMAFMECEDLYPKDANGNLVFSEVDFLDTWKAMEGLLDAGLVRTLGLANFNRHQIDLILRKGRHWPCVLQIELHPYLNQTKLVEYCQSNRIVVCAYSCLGSKHTPYPKPGDCPIMEHPVIKKIAEAHGKSAAQVLLRYQLQRCVCVTPYSVTPWHMRQNRALCGFKLTADEMAGIAKLECNGRYMKMEMAAGHPFHPFETEEERLLKEQIEKAKAKAERIRLKRLQKEQELLEQQQKAEEAMQAETLNISKLDLPGLFNEQNTTSP